MKNNNNLDNSSDNRVENLLTPRFAPTTSLSFKAPAPRRRPLWQAVRISAVAAMVAVAVVIGISGVQTSTAREVVEQAMMRLAEADSYLIHFTARVTKSTDPHDLYEIVDSNAAPMQGIVEIRKEGSKAKMAIKWQDDERSMELYDGQTYRRYQNGQLVLERPDKGIDLTPFASLEKLKPYAAAMGMLLKFREEGDTIIVSDRSDKVEIVARFSKSEGRLLSAECTTPNNVTVLTVDQIDFDVPPTE
ncbi:MAG: hypothetical protein J6J56_04580 [Rikenellaceae bacterium]|nr:hypothetical protein [Rikenellaceae bacterium]MBP3683019.1 hypothetical protein [Rikenellaceae bacterium]